MLFVGFAHTHQLFFKKVGQKTLLFANGISRNFNFCERNYNNIKEKTMKKNIFKLKRSFTFEGENYTELDMTALEDITGRQLYEAEKIYTKNGGSTVAMEYSLDFIFTLCNIVLNKPIEFFYAMSATDTYRLKYFVASFLEGTEIQEQSEKQQ